VLACAELALLDRQAWHLWCVITAVVIVVIIVVVVVILMF
jgi:hypothetical protein